MILEIPQHSLVILIGTSGSGKSTFARKHFKPSEILSSDNCRLLVSDDENDQSATRDAFAVLHLIAERRLGRGKLAVIDATNVELSARKPLISLATKQHAPALAIVLDLPENIAIARHRNRIDRDFDPEIIRRQHSALEASLPKLDQEGFTRIYVLKSEQEIDSAVVQIVTTPSSQRYLSPIAD
jgi:predicted kinase